VTALLYFLVAVAAVALSTRAWLEDRQEPARQAFLVLGSVLGIALASFSLSLLPGLEAFRLGFTVGGGLIPAASYVAVDRLFGRADAARGRWTIPLWGASAVVIPALGGIHAVFYLAGPHPSPPELAAGLFAFSAFGLVFQRLWQAHDASALPVERTRIRWLAIVIGLAVAFALLEQVTRNLAAPIDPGHLPFTSRGVVLQGAVPPFSAVFTGIAIYLLYHSVVSYRMLDLNEVSARAAALVLSACLLLVVDGITFLWVDTFTRYPFHSTFQVFLTSLVFLAAYDPLRDQVRWLANRLFNQRGQQLTDTLVHLGSELPTVLTSDALVETVLARLHASGRVATTSFYLWNPRLDAFGCVGRLGHDVAPLPLVAAQPFTSGFAQGEIAYLRADLLRRGRAAPVVAEVAALLDAMHADLAVPIHSGTTVFGWLALRDEPWSDGYSVEEVQRLVKLADLCRLVLSNTREIAALEERQRLAALGEMAAGLAHEIRNPLAGLKGAAQYLQADDVAPESREMLQVIVDEVDRLNTVVSQFLDYARPFELLSIEMPPNTAVTHALGLLRAQGLPPGIQLEESLAPDLPLVPIDAPRLAQVLLNLLQNAVQAMPDGGTLSVTTRRQAMRTGQLAVEIAVADTGVGIEPEQISKLFVPFYTTRSEGTGLGLAISRRIVDAHGGELLVESAPGCGATFEIRLPVPTPVDAPTSPSSRPEP
jgi:signal transduction histidine kinase